MKNAEVMRFGTIVALILFANYKRIWVWGSELRECQQQLQQSRADCAKITADATETIEKWQNRTLTLAGLTETAIGIKKSQVP